MKRDKSFDIAKGIAVILMIYGHLRYTLYNMDTLYSWIYSFHMPFFMYISGFLTKGDVGQKIEKTIEKAKKIFIPYLIWNIVGFLVNTVMGIRKQSLWQFLHGIFFADDLNSNLPTWYLVSFFWITLLGIFILPLLDTNKKLGMAVLAAMVVVLFSEQFRMWQDYFRWKGAVVLLPFYLIGYLLKKIEFRLPWWLIFPFLYIGFKLGRVNAVRSWGYVTVGIGDVGVSYLYLLSAFFTILAMIEICRYLAKIPAMEIVAVFGRHSLFLLCTHWVLGNLFGTYMEHGWGLFLLVFAVECILIGIYEFLLRKKYN